jgi:hypothetical protein
MAWGATGTLMQLSLDTFFRTWTPKLAQLIANAEEKLWKERESSTSIGS